MWDTWCRCGGLSWALGTHQRRSRRLRYRARAPECFLYKIHFQDMKPSLTDMEAVPDVGGREQGDGMEKEEDEQHIKTFKDQDQPPLPPPTSNLPDTHQKQEKEEEAVPPICQMSEPLINNASSSPSMESAKIIRKSTGLLLPEAGGLVVSKLPPIHDNVDLRPTIPVC